MLPDTEKIKSHFQENKKFYIGVGVGACVILVFHQRPIHITNTVAPVFNNDNSSSVNMGGHMTKMVMRMSDRKIWETVTDAAKDEGVTLSKMSSHLNGRKDHVNHEIYKIIGVGTAA